MTHPRGTGVMSIAEAARHLGVHPNTVRIWTDLGRLPVMRINERGDRRYRVEDLDAFLAAALEPERPPRAIARDVLRRAPSPAGPEGNTALRARAGGRRPVAAPRGLASVAAATAVERVQALETELASLRLLTRRQQDQWRSLHQLAARLAQLGTVEEVGAAITAQLRDVIPHASARVYEVVRRELLPIASRGEDPHRRDGARPAPQRTGEGLCGWVAQTGVAVNIADTARDPRAVVEEIVDRLGALVSADNIAVDVHDRGRGLVVPLTARGVHAELFLSRSIADTEGVAGWVIAHGEGQLVADELRDERVAQFDEIGDVPGALIVVPLRGRDGVAGVLTLERLGADATFTPEEFELVKLFAAQASIALANAQRHHAVEVRAQTDGLTGLPNHGTFHERLAAEVARGEPFSLVMIDLDHFKDFNDSRGHRAGDALLARIAAGLRSVGREHDDVFRYGGDEFAMLLPGTDAVGSIEVAERVRQAVGHAGEELAQVRTTASIGVATFPLDAADRERLLLAADRACYAAKRAGRDRIATSPEGLRLAGEFLAPEVDPAAPAVPLAPLTAV